MHQGIVNLECITLVVQVESIQAFLIHLESSLSVNNGSSGNHLLIKVQVSTIMRQDMCYVDVPYLSNKLEVQHYVLHILCPSVLMNFWCLIVICFLLFQLPLMLVLQHRCAADMLYVIYLGAAFHYLNMNAASFRFLATRMEIWSPLSDVFLLTKPPGFLITSQIEASSLSDRLAWPSLGHPQAS